MVDFQAFFESGPGLYVALAPDLKIVAASDSWLRATRTRREDVIGRDLADVFPDGPEELRASLRRVLRHRGPDTMAVQKHDVRRPDGSLEERFWSPLNW